MNDQSQSIQMIMIYSEPVHSEPVHSHNITEKKSNIIQSDLDFAKLVQKHNIRERNIKMNQGYFTQMIY